MHSIPRLAPPLTQILGDLPMSADEEIIIDACKSCRWWVRMPREKEIKFVMGECRRGHPGPVGTNYRSALTAWPRTKAREWCAEGQPGEQRVWVEHEEYEK